MSEKTESFVYPGLSKEDVRERFEKQAAEILSPVQFHPDKYDPPHIKEHKEKKRAGFKAMREKEIAAGLKDADASMDIQGVLLLKGEVVEVSVKNKAIGKLRTLKELGVLTGRPPGRPAKVDK